MSIVIEDDRLRAAIEKVENGLARNSAASTWVIRVHSRLVENYTSEAAVEGYGMGQDRSFRFIADEPELLGGCNLAPYPLEYLLAGLNACFQSTCVAWALKLNVPIGSPQVHSRAYFNARGIVVDEDASFAKIVCDVSIESPADETKIRKLIDVTESHCVAYRTLSKAVTIKRLLTLNGKQIP